jgi:ABC-type transport system involved in multi-copper enzyme maturation permease subunit
MIAIVYSELLRLRRRSLLAAWFGLTALFAVMINMVMFSTAGKGTSLPPGAPGVAFPNAAALAGPDGLVAGLAAASSMFGVVTLSLWAVATATDYSSGLIRLLVSAQPHRWRLLIGKVVALTALTAVATTVAMAVCLLVAAPTAGAAGVSTAAWGTHPVSSIAGAWLNAFAAQLAWGVLGLVIAVLSRSSTVAIAVGVGYVLVVESVVKMAIGGSSDWLLGSTLNAVASGGTATLAYGSALGLALVYVAAGLVLANAVVTRRDVTD